MEPKPKALPRDYDVDLRIALADKTMARKELRERADRLVGAVLRGAGVKRTETAAKAE